MDIKDRIEFIQRNAEEILNGSEMHKVLSQKNLKVYCGHEPSGEIHLGHLVTMVKLLDLQNAFTNLLEKYGKKSIVPEKIEFVKSARSINQDMKEYQVMFSKLTEEEREKLKMALLDKIENSE